MRRQDLARIHEVQGRQHHQVALPPPYHKIPLAFQSNVDISDIRDPIQIEAEHREALSDYVVFQFEKLDDPGNVDEEGFRVKPNWERATRRRLDMSKQAAMSQICRLNNKRQQLREKKNSLEPAQQRHLDRTLQQLHQDEHDQRYHYELVQIREKHAEKRAVEYHRPSKGSKDGRRILITRHGASVSRDRGLKGHKRERPLSLTGYFKRMPRPEVNATNMMMQQGQPAQRAFVNDAAMFLPQSILNLSLNLNLNK
ncbi:hypothetical protein ACHAQH_005321 [Verticillium albo-atrum]